LFDTNSLVGEELRSVAIRSVLRHLGDVDEELHLGEYVGAGEGEIRMPGNR
jgi:hypothetical protein